MLKKVCTVALALLLFCCCPALALADTENGAALDDRLAAVTLLVKEQLDIGDEYTGFDGSLSGKSINSYWDLRWYGDQNELRVTADETGKIVNYDYSDYSQSYRGDSYFAPAFPGHGQQQLEQAAQKFLAKILRKGETVKLSSYEKTSLDGSDAYLYLYGQLYYNNIATPFQVNIRLDRMLQVRSFGRSDYYSQHVKDITKAPAASQVVGADKALALLGDKTELKLQYVIEDYGAEQLQAALRYLPVYNGDWTVDAKTGELFDFNELYREAENAAEAPAAAGGSAATAEEKALDNGLTEVEQSGIAKLEGVLSLDKLDSILRAESAFGLSGYSRSYGNYYYGEEDQVRCSLTYTMKATAAALGVGSGDFSKLGYTPYIQKYFDVDARTGRVTSLYTYYPYTGYEFKAKLSDEKAQQAGEAFLNKYAKEHFAQTALSESEDYYRIYYSYYKEEERSRSFTYQQQVAGIPFPDNYLSVSVNLISGAIDSFSEGWTDNIRFADARNIVTPDAAALAYNEAHRAELQYLSKPVATDAPIYRPYAELGYSYIYEFMLGYKLSADEYIYAVDAKTGKVLTHAESGEAAPAYDDLANNYARTQIEKLAEYGVGFGGASFLPAKQLTQRDMLQLLVSASYYGIIDQDDDYLYSAAYGLGILTAAEKAPDQLISRAALAKTLVKMSGYGKTAMLTDIYQCGFADDSAIARADYGYIAIAKGMGVIKGDQNNRFNPGRVVNRAEAAVMFYNFLNRSI